MFSAFQTVTFKLTISRSTMGYVLWRTYHHNRYHRASHMHQSWRLHGWTFRPGLWRSHHCIGRTGICVRNGPPNIPWYDDRGLQHLLVHRRYSGNFCPLWHFDHHRKQLVENPRLGPDDLLRGRSRILSAPPRGKSPPPAQASPF